MLIEPIPATRRAFERSGRKIEDIALYEVNEAFAPVPLAWLREIGGDPSGSTSTAERSASATRSARSGTKLMTTLIHALRKRGGGYGLQTMCEGGGIANVTIVEAL